MRFNLTALFVLITLAAVITAFFVRPTLLQFAITALVVTLVCAVYGHLYFGRPVLFASIAGFSWPCLCVLIDAMYIVITNQRFQGQLYDEDGPGAFVIKTILVLVILGTPGFLFGNVIGWSTYVLGWRNKKE